VRFALQLPGGHSQVRFSTPPADDPDLRWLLPVDGRRELTVEIPSRQVLPVGVYQVEIEVDQVGLAPHSFRVAEAEPVAAAGVYDSPTAVKVGQQAVWVHRAAQGFQLYLHLADAADPTRALGSHHLADLAGPVQPYLALSLPNRAWSRHVYWLDGERALTAVQLAGPGRPAHQRTTDLPWPRVRLLGVGITDSSGVLHVPVWIPAPAGPGGEVRVVSWGERRAPSSRAVVRLDSPPGRVSTGIDGSSDLRLVLHHDGVVDLYTVDTRSELPARGRRVIDPGHEAEVLASRFAFLPEGEGRRGGRALFLLEVQGGEWVRGRSVAPTGETVHLQPDQPWAGGFEVLDLLPVGADGFAALLRDEDGGEWVMSDGGAPRPGPGGLSPALVGDADGDVWLRSWGRGGPVSFWPIAGRFD